MNLCAGKSIVATQVTYGIVAVLLSVIPFCESHGQSQDSEIQIVDFDNEMDSEQKEQVEFVTVDRQEEVYLGHPTTCLLEDGRTMLCVYPKGHGRGSVVYKRSQDGGKTWTDRLPTPDSWTTSKETPTLHRVVDAQDTNRIIMFSGLYPIRMAVSEDDGESWSELEKIGDFGGIVAMSSVFKIAENPGHYVAMFHDDGRFITKEGKRSNPVEFDLLKTISKDGGLTWSTPKSIVKGSEMHLCEPGVVRSPDGKQLACLLRENSRRHPSQIIFSNDEGRTWSQPKAMPKWLWGDRHVGQYLKDGRLFISFRCNWPRGQRHEFQGDWVAWVGNYDDLVNGGAGDLFMRIQDNTKAADCAYPGVEVLPDGTVVTTTYGHWEQSKSPYILTARIKSELLE